MNEIIMKIDEWLWGIPLMILIFGCGVFLTARLGGVQFRKLGTALKYMVKNEEAGEGDVTSFGALCTALSATIGTGNIVGVATAIAAGGPGALFWMEVAALLGMATKYSEGLLAIKFRTRDSSGNVLGGPFYYIENGMGAGWKWLAKIFAVFGTLAGLFGIGTITQINGITSAANSFFSDENTMTLSIFGNEYTIVTVVVGLIVTVCAGLVLIGGIQSISKVSELVVPFMAAAYVLCVLVIIFTHLSEIPAAIGEIIGGAFGLRPFAGASLGGTIMLAAQKGIARGIFSNEAGLGSAPIAAAAAKTKSAARQGLVTMTGTFIDTICICTMTGLAIVISGSWADPSLKGVNITMAAFDYGLPLPEKACSFLLMLCLIFFAFTTILGWSYYSERCLSYVFGSSTAVTRVFHAVYIFAILIGPYLTVEAVWGIADIFNALMAVPNVTALIMLSEITASETKDHLLKRKKPIVVGGD